MQQAVENQASMGAIQHVDGWLAEPRRGEVVDRDRDVLCEVPVEDPDLPVRCRLRDSMTVVVEQHPLVLHSHTGSKGR